MQIIWKIDAIVLNFNKCNSKIIYIYKIKLVEENTLKKQKQKNNFQTSFLFYLFYKLGFINPTKLFFKIKNCFLEFSIRRKFFFLKTLKIFLKVVLKNWYSKLTLKTFPKHNLSSKIKLSPTPKWPLLSTYTQTPQTLSYQS